MFKPSMPHEIWAGLSDHARRIAARIKTAPGEWPTGAGVMHPLSARRAEVTGKPAEVPGRAPVRR